MAPVVKMLRLRHGSSVAKRAIQPFLREAAQAYLQWRIFPFVTLSYNCNAVWPY